MPQPIDESNRLYRLAEAHLISQDDIGTSTPVVCKEVHSVKLKGPQLAVLDVVRLLVQLDELSAGTEVRFA